MHSSMLLQLPTAIGGTATARGMQQVQHFQASQIGCHAMHMRPSCPLNASQAARPSSAQMMCVAGPCATFVSQPLRCSSMQQSSAGDGTSGASRSGGAMCSHVRGWGSWQRGGRSRGGPATASDDDDFALQLSTSSDTSSSSESEGGGAAEASSSDGNVATIQLDMPRRSLQVTFRCNVCDARTHRMVNPIAWDNGLVMAKCSGCDAWHKLRDAGNLVEEIRYADEDAGSTSSGDRGSTSGDDSA